MKFKIGDLVHIVDDANGVVKQFDGKFYHISVQRVAHKSSISLCTENELETAKQTTESFFEKDLIHFEMSATHYLARLLELSEKGNSHDLTVKKQNEAAFLEGLKQFRATGRVISVIETFAGDCEFQVHGYGEVGDDDSTFESVIKYKIIFGNSSFK